MDGDQPHDQPHDAPHGAAPATATRLERGRRRPSGRRVPRSAALALAVLVPALTWGVTTAQAQASLGPHEARYEVTVDHLVTIDLGPLGTLVVDSPLPLTFGARVVVQGIPDEVTAVDPAATLEALGADLQGYAQFFGSPQQTLDDAVDGIVADAVRRSLLAALALGLGVAAVRAALGPRRRVELAERLAQRRVLVGVTGTAVILVVTLTSSGPAGEPDEGTRTASAVFDGTPLEGARMTGRLAGVIDTYGGYVVDAYRSNEDFYDGVVSSLDTAWAERAVADEALAARRDEHVGDEEPAAAASVEPVVLLVVSDLHCNVGMARVIGAVARLADVDVVLNAGDTTVNGTGVEGYCVTAFVDAAGGATTVVADGNHDSSETSAQQGQAGAVVLDGAVVEVHGLRILGDADPNATRIGAGTRSVGEESLLEAGSRLADVSCAQDVDLLLVHTPAMGTESLERGCAPVQISGHLHRRFGPQSLGGGVRYISASTAGATLDQPTVGPLQGIAELTVLRADPATGAVLDHRLVRVAPDGSVAVGQAAPWPTGGRRAPTAAPPTGRR